MLSTHPTEASLQLKVQNSILTKSAQSNLYGKVISEIQLSQFDDFNYLLVSTISELHNDKSYPIENSKHYLSSPYIIAHIL